MALRRPAVDYRDIAAQHVLRDGPDVLAVAAAEFRHAGPRDSERSAENRPEIRADQTVNVLVLDERQFLFVRDFQVARRQLLADVAVDRAE